MSVALYLGDHRKVLTGTKSNALIFDAPYSKRTHESEAERNDGSSKEGLAPSYSYFTPDDVREFCESRLVFDCDGWMVSLTDSELAPVWRAEAERVGRYAFAPVPCVITGMSCRMQGDGPSSWTLYACASVHDEIVQFIDGPREDVRYAMVSRPRTKEFATWGTLPGAYVGPRENGAGGGRGKPSWLMSALVRDYSRAGDVVCDPFAGWGATLAAALANGRTAIGAEVDADAHAEAMRRLSRPVLVDLFAEVA